MADGKVIIDTMVDSKGAVQGMNKVNNAVKQSAKGISLSLGKIAGLVATAFSVKAIKNFISETKELYNVQEQAELKLATILKQRTNATDGQIDSIKRLASEQQKIGVIGDEIQLSGAQQIATFVSETESVEKLIPAMNNLLAQQNGLNSTTSDAVSIGNLMGKVLQGQTSALTRVGITFSEAEEQILKYGNESEKASTLAKVITNNVGNMNEALAQTDAGKQQQLANTMGDVKEKFGQAFQTISALFIPILSKVADITNEVADAFIQMSKALGFAFGTSTQQGANAISNSISNSAGNMDELTEATDKAKKSQDKLLSGYDNLEVINKNTSTSTGTDTSASASAGVSGMANIDYSKSTSEVSKLADKFKELAEAIKTPYGLGSTLGNAISTGLRKIDWDTAKSKVADFGKAIAQVINGFADTDAFGNIGTAFGEAINTITTFHISIADTLDFTGLGNALSTGVNNVFKTVSFADIGSAIATSIVGACNFITAFQNGINPTVIGNSIGDIFKKVNWLELAGSIVKMLITGLTTAFIKFPILVLTAISKIISNAVTGIKDYFVSKIQASGGSVVKGLLKGIKDAIVGIGSWILNNVGTPIKNAVTSAIKGIDGIMTNLFGDAWKGIKKVFSGVATFFKETFQGGAQAISKVVSGIKGFFTSAWDVIKKGAKTLVSGMEVIFDGLVDVVKFPINLIIGFINTLIQGVETAINFIIKAVNKLSFDVPDWVPGIGGATFGFDLSKVNFTKIPKLATGGVLPANKPFMAMLGDQKHGTNIEAPLDTIKQALVEALQSYSPSKGDVVVQIDGREVFRAVQNQNAKYNKMNGGLATI